VLMVTSTCLQLSVLSLATAPMQVSNLVEDAQAGKALKGPNSSTATTPLSPTTAHAIFAATVSTAGCCTAQGPCPQPKSVQRISGLIVGVPMLLACRLHWSPILAEALAWRCHVYVTLFNNAWGL